MTTQLSPQRRTHAPFAARHRLWTDEQAAAAAALRRTVETHDLEIVRVSFPDLYGRPRGKALMADRFLSALEHGFEIGAAPLLLGSADERVFDSFGTDPAGLPELRGSANLVMVPDPSTFRVLPWAPGTGWVIADCYFTSGRPCPLATRFVMRRALDELHAAGFEHRAGLEVECTIFRLEDPKLRPGELGGGPGFPADPPEVSALNHGFTYLSEDHLDEVDDLLRVLRRHLLDLGLPLRSIDDEWGPGQLEFVFEPLADLAAADAMFLFRTAVKQACRRLGYLASFMCKPAVPTCYANGWHLHQSLAEAGTGANAFAPDNVHEPLAPTGRAFVGGLLEHAPAASVFTTPTVNGYKRRKAFSLAPDRVTWGVDHRGAMVRVWGASDPQACHIENRSGEPAANPYLYMASQIVAGLDGLRRDLDPGPPSDTPYADTAGALLPTSLAAALDALQADDFYREQFGDVFVDYLLACKRSEAARYHEAIGGEAHAAAQAEVVTDWEQREYFERL
jgi:glutamine synthetase